jgi:3-hydroxyacyl-CoA dehydrogenase/enoyl-CoA hydratase/3-hydroxybutyryl-CoA epimerase
MKLAYGERMESAPLWKYLREQAATSPQAPANVLVKRRFGGSRLNTAMAQAIRQIGGGTRTVMSHEAIIQRLVYPIINEAARCLDEKVAESADDIDLAMVFGTGFAPFRGGPLRYADSVGVAKIVETLERLSDAHPRLTPSEPLRRMAAEGRSFHPATDPLVLASVT